MNIKQLKPTTQKAVKGMKWVAYTMDTTPKFYKTLKEADNEQGFCDATLHRSVYKGITLGYTSTSGSGRTLNIDNLNRVNNEHIEYLFINMIEGNMQDISYRIEREQERNSFE